MLVKRVFAFITILFSSIKYPVAGNTCFYTTMEIPLKLDSADYQLLYLLQQNAKVTNAYLSEQTGLPTTTVFERVKRLENSGYIKNYYISIDKEKAGLRATFFLQVSLIKNTRSTIQVFLNRIMDLPEITECHHITGSANFLLKIVTTDIQTFQQLVTQEISRIQEVGSLQSMIVLSVIKESKVMPVPIPA